MTFTFQDIYDYLDELVNEGTITKQGRGRFVLQVAQKMKTITELRSPNRDQFIAAHDNIAETTLSIWDLVVKHLYEVEQKENKRLQEEQDAIIAANKRKEEIAKLEAEVNPVFTISQLKSLTAMMDLCALQTINLRRINEFFKAVGVDCIKAAS